MTPGQHDANLRPATPEARFRIRRWLAEPEVEAGWGNAASAEAEINLAMGSEAAICRIPGATLIPLGELPKRLGELPQGPGAPDIVVHCKMGGRSAKAVQLLRENGVTRVQNLTGGILAWIDRIDPTQTKY